MEQILGLMCGAGALPAHVASEAQRQGWRVVAFAFGDAPALERTAARAIKSRLTDIGPVLDALREERISAVVFAGKLWGRDVIDGAASADPAAQEILRRAGGLSDEALARAVVGTLAGMGIEVLDQRRFLASLLFPRGTLTSRVPDATEWQDIRLGLGLARQCATFGAGQTVVVRRGVVTAVEGMEGTSDAIRRGCRLAGPGAVVVKAASPRQDYRFDVPTVGDETLRAMAEGGAGTLAVEAERVLLMDREAALATASRERIAIVGLDADAA